MANNDFIIAQGLPNRELPVAAVNGLVTAVRTSRYGEPVMQVNGGGGMQQLADEGSFFVATNPTLGTPIAGTAAPTAFSATVALMTMFNTVVPGSAGAKRLYPAWLALEVRAVGTNGTSFQYAISIDTGNRFASGGSAITPVNPNMDAANAVTSIATLNFGAITATAANNSRRVKHGQVRPVIKVLGDVYLFLFGQPISSAPGADLGGANVQMIPIHCPPVVLGPNQSLVLHEVAPSQSVAATYEFSMGWWER